MKNPLSALRKRKPTENGDERGYPGYLLGGRIRTSTVLLIIAFFLVWLVYDAHQQEAKPAETPQVVPPGFIPDPNYTWVPRTRLQQPPVTVTLTPPTVTETMTPPPEPVEPFPPPFCPPFCPPPDAAPPPGPPPPGSPPPGLPPPGSPPPGSPSPGHPPAGQPPAEAPPPPAGPGRTPAPAPAP